MGATLDPRRYTVSINNKGSGCLFQPLTNEYCYVLTARHVVEPIKEDLIIEREYIDGGARREKLTILEGPFYHPDNKIDAAIIKVKNDVAFEFIQPDIPEGAKSGYLACGFPGVESPNQELGKTSFYSMDVSRSVSAENHMIEFRIKVEGSPRQDDIEGMSGGGVIRSENRITYLVGVNGEMAREAGLPEIKVVSMQAFYEIINAFPKELSFLSWESLENFIDHQTQSDQKFELKDLHDSKVILDTVQKKLSPDAELTKENIRRWSCPYMGLDSFKQANADYYFGRDNEYKIFKDLIQNNNTSHILIIGGSGSGKSSFINTKLLNYLKNDDTYIYDRIRPSTNPLETLWRKLYSLAIFEEKGEKIDYPDIEDKLSASANSYPELLRFASEALDEMLEAIFSRNYTKKLVLILDQFEEVYSLNPSKGTALIEKNEIGNNNTVSGFNYQLFQDLLLKLYDNTACIPIISCRSDFYHELIESGFAKNGSPEIKLGPLKLDDLQDVIAKPAEMKNVVVTDELVTELSGEALGKKGILPFLQVLMKDLWIDRKSTIIDKNIYDVSGGLIKSIERHANRVYDGFTTNKQEKQDVVKNILVQLVNEDAEANDLRKPVLKEELAENVESEYFDEVLDLLLDQRLLSTTTSIKNQPIIEVTHESLLREWPKFKYWYEESRIKHLNRNTLKEWVENAKENDKPLSQKQLNIIDSWKENDTSPDLKEFEDAIQSARSSILTKRIFIIAFIAILISGLGYVGYDLYKENQSVRAQSLFLKGRGAQSPNQKRDLFLQSLDVKENEEVRDSLYAVINKNIFYNSIQDFDTVYKAVFSPDGKFLAIESKSKANTFPVTIYSFDGNVFEPLEGFEIWSGNPLNSMIWSKGSEHLYLGGTDQRIQFVNLENKSVFKSNQLGYHVKKIISSPDGKYWAHQPDEKEIIYISNSKSEVAFDSIAVAEKGIYDFAFISEDEIAVSVSDSSIWGKNITSGVINKQKFDRQYYLLEYDADFYFYGITNTEMHYLHKDEQGIYEEMILDFGGNYEQGTNSAVIKSPDSNLVMVINNNNPGVGGIWRAIDNIKAYNVLDSVDNIVSAAFIHDNKYLISINEEGRIDKWRLKTSIPYFKERGNFNTPQIRQNEDGLEMNAIVDYRGILNKVIDGNEKHSNTTKIFSSENISGLIPYQDGSICISKNGKLAFLDNSGNVHMKGDTKLYVPGPELAMIPSGILVMSNFETILFYNLKSKEVERILKTKFTIREFAIHPKSKHIYAACNDGIIRIWSSSSYELIDSLHVSNTNLSHLSFADESNYYAVISASEVQLRSLKGDLIKSIETTSSIYCLGTESTSGITAIGLDTGEIWILDTEGNHFHTLKSEYKDPIFSISIEGNNVLSHSTNKIEIWDIEDVLMDMQRIKTSLD